MAKVRLLFKDKQFCYRYRLFVICLFKGRRPELGEYCYCQYSGLFIFFASMGLVSVVIGKTNLPSFKIDNSDSL